MNSCSRENVFMQQILFTLVVMYVSSILRGFSVIFENEKRRRLKFRLFERIGKIFDQLTRVPDKNRRTRQNRIHTEKKKIIKIKLFQSYAPLCYRV